MNSKEALEKLYNIACIQPGPVKEQFITYEKEIKHNKTTKDLYDIISQDLERLEKIEKWVNDKLDYLNNGVFLVPGDYLKGAIKILLELKEVLGNV